MPRSALWQPPPLDHVKFNVDAAVSSGKFGAVGVICRDVAGTFLGASSLNFQHIFDPVALEALAVREVLALAEDLYVHKIQVASDCKIMVDEIKQGTSSNHAAIVHEIIERSSAFIACNLSMSLGARISRLTILLGMHFRSG